MPHVKSGRLRALAITSARPSPLVPELPTLAASGLPGYEVVSNDALFAPPRTPAAVVHRLNEEVARVLGNADIKDKFFRAGVETVGSSPQELSDTVKRDMARLGKLIKDAGIRAD
jgi:tripartite-type tricarboxylate transporter receptor subunit TctC